MTVKNHKVKTTLLSHPSVLTLTGGVEQLYNSADVYAFQDNVTLIGVLLRVAAHPGDVADLDDGRVEAFAEVSRVGKKREDGAIANVFSRLVVCDASGTVLELGQGGHQYITIMFPPGYGIDFDDGDTIYLNTRYINSTGVDHKCDADCLLYFVER